MFFQKAKLGRKEKETSGKKELIDFVASQFKQLAKKNLKIPIQLYHL
jgi:hypothetical protein